MKFRAVFYISSRPDLEERCVYLEAPQRDAARERLRSELSERFDCKPEDVEWYNLVGEFEAAEEVNERVVGWTPEGVIVDRNPLDLD